MDKDEIQWRASKPDYTLNTNKFLREKTTNHAPGSVEETVQNLVKTWEMEASHKVRLEDWGTIDVEKFHIGANGCKKFGALEALNNGNYTNLMQDQSPLYDASTQTWESSHELFKKAMPGSFPWELIAMLESDEPSVVRFSWRHWGNHEGPYLNHEGKIFQGKGKLVELTGIANVRVGPTGLIEDIDVTYDPKPFLLAFLEGEPITSEPKQGNDESEAVGSMLE